MVHVDASKKSVEQGKANARLSGMEDRPIRWIVDDASKFTAREVRRGRRYDGILLDPPKFGRGPTGEVWRLEEHLAGLIEDCVALLDANSRFLVLTVYAVRMSALSIAELLRQKVAHLGGKVEHSERREYGSGQLHVVEDCPLFTGLGKIVDIWNSHGDKVTKLPRGFRTVATTDNSPYAAIEQPKMMYMATPPCRMMSHRD